MELSDLIFWIPDSKTPSGRADLPLTNLAAEAFLDQIEIAGRVSGYSRAPPAKVAMLRRSRSLGGRLVKAGLAYFRIYDLRSTFGTRLSACGVSDEWVTQMLRQGDAKPFKKYSRMKLQMRRKALGKLDRFASERNSVTILPADMDSATVLLRSEQKQRPSTQTVARNHSKIKESP